MSAPSVLWGAASDSASSPEAAAASSCVVVVVVVVVVAVAAVGVMGVAEDLVAVERVAVRVDHLDVVQQPVEGLRLADLGRPARARGRSARRPCGPGSASARTASAMRSYSAARSPSSASRPSATATARRARSTRTACSDAPFMLSTNAVGVLAGDREPLLDVDALRLQLAHGALDAALQVALHERLGRLDLGQPGERLGDPADELLAGLVELGLAEALGDRLRATPSTVSNSPKLLGRRTRRSARAARAPGRRRR